MDTECVDLDNFYPILFFFFFIGNCLETDEGKIKLHSCSNFSDGCPDKPFFDYDFYKCE